MKTENQNIIIEHTFSNSVTDLWSAITELKHMQQWFFNNIPAFQPIRGFETRFDIRSEDRIFPHIWKITAVQPLKKISYDWRYGGYPGKALVTFELLEKNQQTQLILTHKIIEKFPTEIEEFSHQSGIDGWTYFIKHSLPDYLSK
jgi:uncharacterized protein YndB with AHSA1/START domain